MNLRTKILLVFCSTSILLGITLSYFILKNSTNIVISSISNQAKNIAERTVKQINIDEFKYIVDQIRNNPNDSDKIIQMPEFINLQTTLKNIKEINGLSFLYTMAEKESGVPMYVVDGLPMDDEDASLPGEVETEEYQLLAKTFSTNQTQTGELTIDDKYGALLTTYVPIVDTNGSLIGVVGADFDATEIYNLLQNNQRITVILIICILVITMISSFLFANYFLKPLSTLSKCVSKIGSGDFNTTIEINSKDEIGELSRNFSNTVEHLKKVIQTIKVTSHKVNNLTQKIFDGYNLTLDTNHHITAMIEAVSHDSQQLVNDVEESVIAINEMYELMRQISVFASKVTENSQSNLYEAENGNQTVQKAVRQMEQINQLIDNSATAVNGLVEKILEINQILEVITEISSQTSLLALNASIEAARAGEYGSGFVVVADTIRKLSNETTVSTNHISEIINEIQDYSKHSVEAMHQVIEQANIGMTLTGDTGLIFNNIVNSSKQINQQIKAMSEAINELTSSSTRATEAISNINQVSKEAASRYQEVESNAEEQLATMESIAKINHNLLDFVNELEQSVAIFDI